MQKTTAQEVIDSFESSFQDKSVIPFELEMIWLKKAIAQYSVEIDPLLFDAEILEFDCVLDQYVIDTLAQIMKVFYQERYVSLTNKRMSIVGKDISINGMGNSQKYAKDELNYVESKQEYMIQNQKPTAYI